MVVLLSPWLDDTLPRPIPVLKPVPATKPVPTQVSPRSTAPVMVHLPPPPAAKMAMLPRPVTPLAPRPSEAPAKKRTVAPLRTEAPPTPIKAIKPLKRDSAPRLRPATIKPLAKKTMTPKQAKPISVKPIPVSPKKVVPKKVVQKKIPPKVVRPIETPPTPMKSAPRAPKPKIVAAEREASRSAIATGRPLLKLFEHGEGPRIDIAWPEGSGRREALFGVFKQCYGMRVALMTAGGALYSDQSASAPWKMNLDRYSGFVRQSGGLGTRGERAWVRRIQRRHPAAARGAAIRVFPRRVDALLLGGLHRLIGPGYRQSQSIRARYTQADRHVFIDDITVDGTAVAGRIALTGALGRHCGASVHRGES